MLKKVLLIDDSLDQLQIMQRFLQPVYDVICCETGVQAIRYMQDNTPDAVLLDIDMPLMDGFDVLRRIREMEKGINIPVIGVTGEKRKASVLKFISLGGNGYMVKPIDPQKLLVTLAQSIKNEEQKAKEKQILLVDDDMDALRIIQGFLKGQYIVTALNSSTLALEYLHHHQPDLILLDYYMTPYSGISVYKMIRKMELAREVPIAFVTGTTDRDILLECTALRPAGIILKPVKKEDLLSKVKDMMNS